MNGEPISRNFLRVTATTEQPTSNRCTTDVFLVTLYKKGALIEVLFCIYNLSFEFCTASNEELRVKRHRCSALYTKLCMPIQSIFNRLCRFLLLTLSFWKEKLSHIRMSPPVWEATVLSSDYYLCTLISIHASRVGGDQNNVMMYAPRLDFNPRLPRGRRLAF